MRTTTEWWNETKTDPARFNEWLQKQYHGEVTAAERIERYCSSQAKPEWIKTLKKIADQERQHAGWIAALLVARGLTPELKHTPERYWEQTLPQITDFESATAVAAHAEKMRLERIGAIASDESAPQDVRDTFERILHDEIFHEKAFSMMAGKPAMEAHREAHRKGLVALGLIMADEVL
jgi:rubrerythrin